MQALRIIGMAAMAMTLAGCGGADGGVITPPTNPTAVDVRDNQFSPTATTVPVGSTVTWTWRGSNVHDVSFTDGTNSGTKTSGTYARAFSAAGTYDYICTIHGAAMSGRVVVQ